MTSRATILVILTALASVGCQPAQDKESPVVKPGREDELQARLRPAYRIRRPTDPQSRTVVLVVPGCSGFGSKHYDTEAARLVSEGYTVVNVDYLAALRVTTACPAVGDTVPPVSAPMVAEFVLAAAADVRGDSLIRATRVFAVGGSLGGGGVLATLSADRAGAFPLDGVAALYPQCRGVPRWNRATPVLMLLGGLDNIASPAVCQDLVTGRDFAEDLDVHIYPRAHHAFDADELGIVAEARTEPTVAFHPEAATDAWRRITAFLRQ